MSKLVTLGRELYSALNGADALKLQRLLSKNFRGRLTAGLPMGLGRDYTGLDAMLGEAWATVDRLFDLKVKADLFFESNDVLIVHGCYAGTSRITGGELRAAFAHFWIFNGDQFTSMQQITDSAKWHEALK